MSWITRVDFRLSAPAIGFGTGTDKDYYSTAPCVIPFEEAASQFYAVLFELEAQVDKLLSYSNGQLMRYLKIDIFQEFAIAKCCLFPYFERRGSDDITIRILADRYRSLEEKLLWVAKQYLVHMKKQWETRKPTEKDFFSLVDLFHFNKMSPWISLYDHIKCEKSNGNIDSYEYNIRRLMTGGFWEGYEAWSILAGDPATSDLKHIAGWEYSFDSSIDDVGLKAKKQRICNEAYLERFAEAT